MARTSGSWKSPSDGMTRVAVVQIDADLYEYHGVRWKDLLMGLPVDDRPRDIIVGINAQLTDLEKESRAVFDREGRSVIEDIIRFCGDKRGVDVLVFPEFSIPREWLRGIREIMDTHGPPVVIAGTHLYTPGYGGDLYSRLRLETRHLQGYEDSVFVTPVLTTMPLVGSVMGRPLVNDRREGVLIPKKTDSDIQKGLFGYTKDDWNPDVEVQYRGCRAILRVLPCSDFLNTHCLGWPTDRNIGLIVVPAYTPARTVFEHFLPRARDARKRKTTKELTHLGAATLIACPSRSSKFPVGNSFIYGATPNPKTEPDAVQPMQILDSVLYPIPPESPAVMILDLELEAQADGFKKDKWQTRKVTVAPVLKRRSFPDYCQFVDNLYRHTDKGVLRERICSTEGEGQALRRSLLDCAHLDDALRCKLTVLSECAALSPEHRMRRIQTECQTFSYQDDDLLRLADVVAVGDERGDQPLAPLYTVMNALPPHDDLPTQLQAPVAELRLALIRERDRLLAEERQEPKRHRDAQAMYVRSQDHHMFLMIADALNLFFEPGLPRAEGKSIPSVMSLLKGAEDLVGHDIEHGGFFSTFKRVIANVLSHIPIKNELVIPTDTKAVLLLSGLLESTNDFGQGDDKSEFPYGQILDLIATHYEHPGQQALEIVSMFIRTKNSQEKEYASQEPGTGIGRWIASWNAFALALLWRDNLEDIRLGLFYLWRVCGVESLMRFPDTLARMTELSPTARKQLLFDNKERIREITNQLMTEIGRLYPSESIEAAKTVRRFIVSIRQVILEAKILINLAAELREKPIDNIFRSGQDPR